MATESSYKAEDKPELVADMLKCEEHLHTLLETVKSSDPAKLKELVAKHEAQSEAIQKIFVNWEEEWKLVLGRTRGFMDVCLEILQINDSVNIVLHSVCEFLRSMTLCISPKRMARYWPTEVEWLTKLVTWIELFFERNSEDQKWSTLYVLIMWLSSAVKTPFNLSRFDSSTSEIKFVSRISSIIARTSSNYKLFSVFHILAGSFYSRPDILRDSSQLFAFIELLLADLSPPNPLFNQRLCRFRTIAALLKSIDRNHLKPYLERIFLTVLPLVTSSHELQTKYCIKILGRIALAQIKMKLLKYRYDCGKRVLDFDSLKTKGAEQRTTSATSGEEAGDQIEETIDTEELEEELPYYFENLIQTLIENIHNPGGQEIHYSVAKYLASICWRLPQEFTNEILLHVCENLCQPSQDANAWHGACLTLAEFVRRGYVPIEFMPKIVEVIKSGLFYEEIKGSFALGSFVRDSAAYICWAMARGYDGNVIGDFVDELAPVLINSVCFDKNLNVRRASSAVIQELAGRTQRFPNWIEVISRTDFNSLSKVERTYIELGFYFGSTFVQFTDSMIEHLCENRIVHSDPEVRRLAARTLGELSKEITFRDSKFCSRFYDLMLGNDMNSRHGSILVLANLALNDPQLRSTEEFSDQIIHLVAKLSQKNLFFGLGGDFMRESCLILIRHCSLVGLEAKNISYLTSWSEFLLNTILHCETEFIQPPLIDACKAFWKFLPNAQRTEFIAKLLQILSVFGNYTPISIISKILISLDEELLDKQFLKILLQFFNTSFQLELRKSETIADSVKAIIVLADKFSEELDSTTKQKIVEVWFRALDDHTINKTKGDVGLFVRKAAIQAISVKENGFLQTVLSDEQIFTLFRLTLTEALQCQKMTFIHAAGSLSRISRFLLENSRFIIPSLYLEIIAEDINFQNRYAFMEDVYQELLKLFPVPELSSAIWLGCIGILSQPSMRKFHDIIFNTLRSIEDENTRRSILGKYLEFLKESGKDKRLVLACLEATKVLLMEIDTELEFQRAIADICWENCQSIRNVKNFIATCDVICSLIPLSGTIILRKVYSFVYVLLGYQAPRIRSYAATELYSALLSLDEGDEVREICQYLQSIDWINSEDNLKARDMLREKIRAFCEGASA